MAEPRPTYITGTVDLDNGDKVSFSLTPNLGWQQWGGTDLGHTVDLMDALAAASSEFLYDPDNEPADNTTESEED